MLRIFTLLRLLVLPAVFSFVNVLSAADLPPGFAEIRIAKDLDPVAMAIVPDGRVFLIEKYGAVRIIENGQLLPDPLLVLDQVDNYNERGLSGIAIDPDFEMNGYFYLYYTVRDANHNRVSRFTAWGNSVLAGSETVLLELDPMNGTIHNAGSMAFGPDDKLYIATGDGSYDGNSQDMNNLLGKILRINPDGSIPDDNPFFSQATGKNRAIWALGFRNPFSLAFQPGTGRLFSTEVGSHFAGAFEEVNEILKGRNYGWPLVEGYLAGQIPPDQYMDPVHGYTHDEGCAIVGAAFYNPVTPVFPVAYHGKFFYSDYCEGYIQVLDPVSGQVETFAEGINRPLNLLVAPDGTLYYIARAGLGGGSQDDNTATSDGSIWRVFYTGSGAPFISAEPQSVLIPKGEDATFFVDVSGIPPFQFQWQQNGFDIPGANDASFLFEQAVPADSGSVFRCIVTNAEGADTSLTAVLKVVNGSRPDVQILTPLPGTTYRAGDLLTFSGQAFDAEEGGLSNSSLTWKIDFHHDTHTHPGLLATPGIGSGSFSIPQVGEVSDNVWYRIYLTARDGSGLTNTVSRDIQPEKSVISLQTQPPGFPVYIDGSFTYTPESRNSVVGVVRHLTALPTWEYRDSLYLFTGWSNGEKTHDLIFETEPVERTYTAVYEALHQGKGTGLRGYYYKSEPWNDNFVGFYRFERIDETINFNWGGGSPNPDRLGDDFFHIRWKGYIEPYFDDVWRFYLTGDDGIRLWVDDQLIIDAWVPQPETEWTGEISLKGGVQVPIQIEYFEFGGEALCQLEWSSKKLGKSVVSKSQLYPELIRPVLSLNRMPVKIYPNPVQDVLWIEFESAVFNTVDWTLFNVTGQVVQQASVLVQKGITLVPVNMKDLADGIYLISMKDWKETQVLKVVKSGNGK